MKKKLATLFFTLSVMSMNALPTFAVSFADNNPITVKLDNKEITFDQPPIVESGRTLVPFRAILEAMNVDVDWDSETKTITCTKGDKVIKLTIGENEMFINDEEVTLDVPAKIVNGRTLLPLRAISENLDAEVKWDSDTKTIEIKSDSIPVEEENSNTEESKDKEDNSSTKENNKNEESPDDTSSQTDSALFPYVEQVSLQIVCVSAIYEELKGIIEFESDYYAESLDKIHDQLKEVFSECDPDDISSIKEAKTCLSKLNNLLNTLVDFAHTRNAEFAYILPVKSADDKINLDSVNDALLSFHKYLGDYYVVSKQIPIYKTTEKSFETLLNNFLKLYSPYIGCKQLITKQTYADELENKVKLYQKQIVEMLEKNRHSVKIIAFDDLNKFYDELAKYVKLLANEGNNIKIKNQSEFESLSRDIYNLGQKVNNFFKQEDYSAYSQDDVDALTEEVKAMITRIKDFAKKANISLGDEE